MKFGHFKYVEANTVDLEAVAPYRQTNRVVKLHRTARGAFLRMAAAALAEHVLLVPISGFREIAYQEHLFRKAIEKYGTPAEAARWVAPAGYSEHHTGLALDAGDGSAPEADTESDFEQTLAFRWLQRHASDFGFELSFPKDGLKAVAYEPWHWRFVGTPASQRVFERARSRACAAGASRSALHAPPSALV